MTSEPRGDITWCPSDSKCPVMMPSLRARMVSSRVGVKLTCSIKLLRRPMGGACLLWWERWPPPAVDFRLPRGERVQVCWHCNQQQVPTTTHVLWECPSFAEVRRLQRPQSALAARLGWSPGMTSEEVTGLLTQLDKIRRREVAARGRMQG